MNRIQSEDHRIGTYKINKISLTCFDDKICILKNGYDGLSLRKNSYLNNYLKRFFVKHIALIFSLIRKAVFSFYKNIVRLLTWHSKFKNRKAVKKG